MNPFTSPSPPDDPSAIDDSAGKEPFFHQAAKFSAYAPWVLVVLGMCVQPQIKAHAETPAGTQLALFLGAISILTTLSALTFGVLSTWWGVTQRRRWTITLGVAGIVVNGLVMALWLSVLFIRPHRAAPVPPQPLAASEASWTAVEIENSTISFELPGGPAEQTMQDEFATKHYRYDDGITTYGATVSSIPQDRVPKGAAQTGDVLEKVLNNGVAGVRGKIIYRKPIFIGDQEGREQEVEFHPEAKDRAGNPIVGMSIGKAFLSRDSVVILGVVANRADYESDAYGMKEKIARFLDSLRL